MSKYHGITHGLPTWQPFILLWWFFRCRHGIHMFDEVMTKDRHYLYCDACGLTVNISSIDEYHPWHLGRS